MGDSQPGESCGPIVLLTRIGRLKFRPAGGEMWVLLFRSVMLTLTVIGFLDLREFSVNSPSY